MAAAMRRWELFCSPAAGSWFPGTGAGRLLLAGVGISLAFGWNWLYMQSGSAAYGGLGRTQSMY